MIEDEKKKDSKEKVLCKCLINEPSLPNNFRICCLVRMRIPKEKTFELMTY
jgi:hypothetical protein